TRTPSVREAYGVVAEHCVDAADAVDELRYPEVDDGARKRERFSPVETMLATHQLEHVLGRERGRLVEVLVEAEGEPRLGRPGGGIPSTPRNGLRSISRPWQRPTPAAASSS